MHPTGHHRRPTSSYLFKPGNPPSDGAERTARRMASDTASAAATPRASMGARAVPDRHRDYQVAVRHGVHWVDRPRHPQLGQLRQLGGFHFGESRRWLQPPLASYSPA